MRYDPDRPGWMRTYTGRRFWPADPDPADVSVEDVAHHLSMICRYNGAVPAHYSVAQHSIYVALVVPREFALQGLLHDAAEAYSADLIRPVKAHFKEIWKTFEDRIQAAVCEAFGVPPDLPAEVEKADSRMAATEQRDLLGYGSRTAQPYPFAVSPLPAAAAEMDFLMWFRELGGKA